MRKLQWEVLQHERLATASEISACLAHDIGNLLDGTLNGLRILEQEAGNAKECKKWCHEIIQRVEKLPPVLHGLLQLTRRKILEKEVVAVNDIINQALFFVEFRTLRKQIQIQYSVEPSPPPVYGDPVYLTMVVANLLLNAIDAVSANGRIHVISRRSLRDQGFLEIVVEDNGCGIPATDLERIFEPFYTTKPEGKGTGLGLTIAKRIVSEHKGDIRVLSTIGKGSIFTVLLPCYENGVGAGSPTAIVESAL
jgi:signal transduction histidine kinase